MSIQAADNAASAGATIDVLAGTYTGAVTLDKANLTLESSAGAIIDAGGRSHRTSVSPAPPAISARSPSRA